MESRHQLKCELLNEEINSFNECFHLIRCVCVCVCLFSVLDGDEQRNDKSIQMDDIFVNLSMSQLPYKFILGMKMVTSSFHNFSFEWNSLCFDHKLNRWLQMDESTHCYRTSIENRLKWLAWVDLIQLVLHQIRLLLVTQGKKTRKEFYFLFATNKFI